MDIHNLSRGDLLGYLSQLDKMPYALPGEICLRHDRNEIQKGEIYCERFHIRRRDLVEIATITSDFPDSSNFWIQLINIRRQIALVLRTNGKIDYVALMGTSIRALDPLMFSYKSSIGSIYTSPPIVIIRAILQDEKISQA